MAAISLMGTSAQHQTLSMSSREIAVLVESPHSDVKRSIDRLATKGVIPIPPTAEYLDSLGRTGQTEYLLDKRSSYIVVAQLSPEFTARLVDRWEALESGKVHPMGAGPLPLIATPLTNDLAAVELMARMVRASESGKLGMMHVAIAHHAPHLLPALPHYAIDAPSTGTFGGSEPTLAATELLKRHGASVSAVKFNRLLEDAGYIETLTRASSKGAPKAYKSVTQRGLEYGKNVTSPSNPRETQPHWYITSSRRCSIW